MKIKLRRLRKEDLVGLWKQANDKDVCKNLIMQKYPVTKKFVSNFIKDSIKLYKEKKPSIINFIIDFDDKIAGLMVVREINYDNNRAEIGYWIGKEFWHKGIMVKAIKLVSKYCFEKLKTKRIFATPFVRNKKSHRVLEKSGYVKEGVLKKQWKKDSKFQDSYMYAKTK